MRSRPARWRLGRHQDTGHCHDDRGSRQDLAELRDAPDVSEPGHYLGTPVRCRLMRFWIPQAKPGGHHRCHDEGSGVQSGDASPADQGE
jgi:hypothetical protein